MHKNICKLWWDSHFIGNNTVLFFLYLFRLFDIYLIPLYTSFPIIKYVTFLQDEENKVLGVNKFNTYLMENSAEFIEKLIEKSGCGTCLAQPRNELFSACFLHRLSYFCRKGRGLGMKNPRNY